MRNRRIKKHKIDTKVSENLIEETSSSNGHLDWKVRKISTFRSFLLLDDVNMMLRE